MAVKEIYAETAALEKLLNGVNTVANTVKQTLGPQGRNIILQKEFGQPISCNDGVTIARDIQLADKLEDAGAQFIIEAAKTTNDEAGDGTTSVCVLAQRLINDGFEVLKDDKITSVQLVDGLNKAAAEIVKQLPNFATPVKDVNDLTNVATISCGGNKELGKLVAEALDRVGQYGVCTAEPGPGTDITLTHVEGMAFDRGYINPCFMTDTVKQQAKYKEALVFVTMKTISSQEDILPVLNIVAQEQKPLLLICENLTGQALLVTMANMQRGTVSVVATRLPGFSTFVEPTTKDICAITGAKFHDVFAQLDAGSISIKDFGSCTNLQVTSSATKFIGPDAPTGLIPARLEQAREELETYKGNNDEWAVERTQERIARLGKGASLIQVGARTELEQKELLYRVEDAIQACRAALDEGIVPGAGNIQIRLANHYKALCNGNSEKQQLCDNIIIKALYAIYDQLVINGESVDAKPASQLLSLADDDIGYNPANGQEINLIQEGIIDPAKVTRCSLENAVSVATTLLRTAGAVVAIPEDAKALMNKVNAEHQFTIGNML